MTIAATCLLAFLACQGASGTPDRRATPDRPVDLAGRWILTMPSGAQSNATFGPSCRCHGTLLQLRGGATLLRGGYERKGRRLSMARPEDEKMTGLVWEVRNENLLELVEHPESSQFGSDYRGAVLVRRIDEDPAEPKGGGDRPDGPPGPVPSSGGRR